MVTLSILSCLLVLVVNLSEASRKLPLCSETTKEEVLCSLVEDYNHLKVPQKPTEYFSEITFRGVQEIDESRHRVTFISEMGMRWEDKRLSISNSTDLAQWEYTKVKNDIWIPELYFPNTISLKKADGFKGKHYRHVYYTKYAQGWGTEYDDINMVYLFDVLLVTIDCKMNFADFPFDQQFCEWSYRAYEHGKSELILKAPLLFSNEGSTGATVNYLPVNQSIKFSSSGLPFDVEMLAPESTPIPLLEASSIYSLVSMKINLKRNAREFNKLLISYYLPSGSFAIMSAFSFFIMPEVVPGRMGMLVTIFLVETAIYGSVEAPPLRGFTYIELWYIGVQIPIIFAIIEYGMTLAALKYSGVDTHMKYFPEGTTTGDVSKKVDLISFFLSFTFIVIFICSYLYVSNIA